LLVQLAQHEAESPAKTPGPGLHFYWYFLVFTMGCSLFPLDQHCSVVSQPPPQITGSPAVPRFFTPLAPLGSSRSIVAQLSRFPIFSSLTQASSSTLGFQAIDVTLVHLPFCSANVPPCAL
ncbi:hypothetical protein M9458_014403, partial [Cirrhinus mrigala]